RRRPRVESAGRVQALSRHEIRTRGSGGLDGGAAMSLPLARPVRFPERLEKIPTSELLSRLDKLKNRLLEPRGWHPRALAGLGGRRSGAPAACADCLRGTTLYYGGVAVCVDCARKRALETLTN